MKKVFFAVLPAAVILIAGAFCNAASQGVPYSLEQLNRRLDSLSSLQQEAIRSGGNKDEHSAEKNQIQRAITARTNELRAEVLRKLEEDNAGGNISTAKKNESFDFFAERPLLDNLVIIMGAIAVAAIIFLFFAKIFITISKRNALKPQKQPKEKKLKNEIPQKTANVLSEIDRYKEKETQKAELNQSVIASLKELAKKEEVAIVKSEIKTEIPPAEEKPKKFGAVELKNEIVRRFDKKEDTAKIAQDLGISKDQVVLILSLAGRK